MTPVRQRLVGVAVALLMAGPSFISGQPAPSPAPSSQSSPSTASLYQRLGGIEPIRAVVDEFLARAAANPVIKKRFAGANLVRLREKLIEQLGEATGGPHKYTGLDMKTAHLGMNITEREFNALAGDLKGALEKFKVPAREKNEILAAVGAMKKDIVTPARPRGTRDRVRLLEESVSRLEMRVVQLQQKMQSMAASAPGKITTSQEKTVTSAPAFSEAEKAQVPALKERFLKGAAEPPSSESRGLVGKPLRQSRFINADGQVVNLENFAGKKKLVVLVMRGFAGAVCINCSSQLLALSESIQQLQSENAEVFVVYPGESSSLTVFLDAVNAIDPREMKGLNFLLDVDLMAVRSFDIEAALARPTTLIVDLSGKVSYAYIGTTPADRPSVTTILGELRKAK